MYHTIHLLYRIIIDTAYQFAKLGAEITIELLNHIFSYQVTSMLSIMSFERLPPFDMVYRFEMQAGTERRRRIIYVSSMVTVHGILAEDLFCKKKVLRTALINSITIWAKTTYTKPKKHDIIKA